ncbi:MAG: lipid A-modifier LpxR family protein [Bacteroidota bacterium]
MGTLETGVVVHSTIRAGRMPSYFSGYINQYTSLGKTLTAYLFLKPQVQYRVHNTILEGTTLNYQTDVYAPKEVESATGRPGVEINHQLMAAKAGVVVAYHGFGISATYTHESGLLQHQPAKGYGNVSLYFGL